METKYILIIVCSFIAFVLIVGAIIARNMRRSITGTILEIDLPKGNDAFVLAMLFTKKGNKRVAIDKKIYTQLQKDDYVVLCKNRVESAYDKIGFIKRGIG